MAVKKIKLRYPGKCSTCAVDLAEGTFVWWNSSSKATTCVMCAADVGLVTGDPFSPPATRDSKAGASAVDEYIRRAGPPPDSTTLRVVNRALTPQSTTAWLKGAIGEAGVARRLDSLPQIVAIHDRSVPGSRANIDHVVVARSGVWVVDAKNYSGKLEKRSTSTGPSLVVGGRNRDRLAAGVRKQIAVVEKACGGMADVRGALCFFGVEASLLFRPFCTGGVAVHTLRTLTKALGQPGDLDYRTRYRIINQLDAELRPASGS
ncbi:MAG: NERD domain-containing protein [Acidimicrobiia bacterium]|nr:NERD domain-containing protein [Acidimicrobiia bacterium]